MSKRSRRFITAGVFAVLLLLTQSGIGQTQSALVLTGGTIYRSPAEQPITEGVVLIRNGKIAAVGRSQSVHVPKGTPSLNCSGLSVAAGFWNSHVHFGKLQWANAATIPAPELTARLREMLTRYGFTSVFDLGSPWKNTQSIRNRIESGEVPGPRIRSTGEMILGFEVPEKILKSAGVMDSTPEPAVTDSAKAHVASQSRLDAGADGLKFYAASPFSPATLPRDVIRVIVDEAHRRHKLVFVHPHNREGLMAAVEGGVDILAHTTPISGPWDEAVITAMQRKRVALIPTLKVWTALLRDRDALRDQWTQTNIGQLRAWLAAGGVVLFGTDVDAGMDDYDPKDEYALMAQAGMTYQQILAALTTAPAKKFGDSGRLGRIAPGLVADLVIFDGNPSQDAKAFAAVRYTIRDGRVIYEAAR